MLGDLLLPLMWEKFSAKVGAIIFGDDTIVPKNGISLYNKFVKQVEEIFKKLPKHLEWIVFYVHDFPLITDICEEIRKISVENQLNKAQTKAIADIKKTSEDAFQDIVNKAKSLFDPKKEKFKQSSNTENNVLLREMSAKEIKQIADNIIRKEIKNERNRQRENQDLNLIAKVLIMTRLGIPVDRIAKRLHIDRKTLYDFSDIIKPIKDDVDYRFGDDWPGNKF